MSNQQTEVFNEHQMENQPSWKKYGVKHEGLSQPIYFEETVANIIEMLIEEIPEGGYISPDWLAKYPEALAMKPMYIIKKQLKAKWLN